jgi:ABC-2 type transport system permease protein
VANVLVLFRRELGGLFGQPLAAIVLGLFLALFGAATLVLDDVFAGGVASMRRPFEWIAACFLFLVPAITMRLLAEEKRSGSLELLSTFPVESWEIVVGKWLAATALVALALGLTVPWPIVLAFYGHLDAGPVIGGYLGLLLIGAAYAAIGVFASSLGESQVVAFLLAFVACLSPWAIWWGLGLIPGDLVPFAQYLTFGWHFSNLARGVLDTRSLVFGAGVIILGLRGAILSLELRRLS